QFAGVLRNEREILRFQRAGYRARLRMTKKGAHHKRNRHQLRARSTALMAGVARSAAVMSARCFTSETSTSITISKKSIDRLTMRRLEMLPSCRAITVDRLDRLPGWLATVILRRPV